MARKTLQDLVCESLEPRVMLSTVQLFAAGTTGEEIINLEIDGNVVATYDNLGDQAYQDGFVELNYTTDDVVAADDVRIVFTNDANDEVTGIDRNVRIDAIVIDNVRFETEAPVVFSTGTYLPEDGVAPGFRESEYLHTNGYFQYFGQAVDPEPEPDPFTGPVVINEIHYNPGPDGVVDPDAEFVELYNPGDSDVDLSGMSFTGFDLTFAAGTTLGAGQYAIVSPSIAIAEATWGVTPIAEFAGGGISGGGETIELIAADGVTIIDQVIYDDATPWTGIPDGNGPSLELINYGFNNSDPTNWGASDGDPTPGAENSIFATVVTPDIANIRATPAFPGQNITVSADINAATFANLIYKVGFNGAEQTLAMTNTTGNSWEATLPGEGPGELIRYRIESDVVIAPFAEDSINYYGLVVQPTDIIGNELPVFQFWVDEAAFTELTTTDLALTNTKIEAVVAYGGDVIDNATVRVRGGDFSRINFIKKSLKFELPDGYRIDIGSEGSYGIDEFGIQADYGDWTVVTPDMSWDVFNNETESFTSSFFTRVESNSDFYGLFRFQELYDGTWRDANGYGDSEFYKAELGGFGGSPDFDKKRPEDGDFTSIIELNDIVTALPSAEKTAYLYERIDIPNVINHMAISALMRHDDQRTQNFYMALDPDTQLWSIIEWDLDRTWRELEDETTGPFTTPEPINQELMDSIWDVPEFQDMYWRRMQTLVDTYLGNDDLIARRAELVNEIGAANSNLEFDKWGRSLIFANTFWEADWQNSIDMRRAAFAAETRMPGTASGNANIVINELHYNPAGDDAEFIELYNNSGESIDLSGWSIDGIDLTIDFGTVLLANEYIVFTDNYEAFRGQYDGNILVGAQYSGGLSGGGETITLFDRNGNVVDEVTYDDADPWPTEPDGDGYSLALTDVNLDNNLASSWVPSVALNGTPGEQNDGTVVGEQYVVKVFAAGNTGQEIVTLEIQGAVVATFDLAANGGAAGDLANRNFIEFSYTSDSPVAASDIRVNFVNDVYDPGAGIDYNVAIDRIEIDGETFETEAPNVFSTGTWLPQDGIQPGFRQSEILHTDGYFQYASTGVGNDDPIAGDDQFDAEAGTSLAGNLLTNDSDPNGDPIEVVSSTPPSNGTLTVQANGDFQYTPDAGFSGDDSFTYTISDGNGGVATATVLISVESGSVLADGNIVQFFNVGFNAWLRVAGSGDDAETTSINNTRTHWELIELEGDNEFRLRSVFDGRYLDGDSNSIDTTSRDNSFGGEWELQELGNGEYFLFNVDHQRILDANGSNADVGWDPPPTEADDRWLITLVGE
ncbi:MAG: lamin tail domain-containing protein [Pirellulaceae bacterium]